MKIKMKSLMAGPSGTRHPGQICTVGDDLTAAEARQLVQGGYAEDMSAEAPKGGKQAKPKPDPAAEAAKAAAEAKAVAIADLQARLDVAADADKPALQAELDALAAE